jgi:membrane peptidoglycan carboxypeptidase
VLQVETVDGKVLWRARPKKERIVPANAVYLVTDILKDDKPRVSMFGANSALNLPGRPAAVKTGSSDNTRDLWAIGYTPQLVSGVWVGNANNKAMPGGTSALVAAPIWRDFMVAALEGQPVLQFQVPDGVQWAEVCATTGQAPNNGCSSVVKEPFIAGRAPAGSDRQPTQRPSDRQQETPTPSGSPTATPAVTGITPTVPPSPTTTPALIPLTPTPPRPGVTVTPAGGPPPPTPPRQATPTRTPNRGNNNNNGGEGND